MFKSLWTETVDMPEFPKLEQDESTDVLIIGAGITGVLCAHFLQEAGISCMVCDAASAGRGTSAGTTAVISAQHDLFLRYVKTFGRQKAKLYLQANLEAVEVYRKLCKQLDCDFEECSSYLYTTNESEEFWKESQLLREFGFTAHLHTEIPIPGKTAAAVEFPAQAQFHPLKFLAQLSQTMQIFQQTRIVRIENNVAYTEKHKIQARKIIITAHYPFLHLHGLYPLKLYQKRSYVLALENAPHYPGSYVEDRENGFYFRNYKNLLILGGGDHRTGKQGEGYIQLREFVRQFYPKAIERFAWSTQDCMSLDGFPYIGPYSRGLPDVYVASGFNEWGMTNALTSAQLLRDLILGNHNPYAVLFSPTRHMMHLQLLSNIGVTLCDYLLPTKKRCPHMGCALRWNPQEHSWDCPCHGSRFAQDGSVLDNPAVSDLDRFSL